MSISKNNFIDKQLLNSSFSEIPPILFSTALDISLPDFMVYHHISLMIVSVRTSRWNPCQAAAVVVVVTLVRGLFQPLRHSSPKITVNPPGEICLLDLLL